MQQQNTDLNPQKQSTDHPISEGLSIFPYLHRNSPISNVGRSQQRISKTSSDWEIPTFWKCLFFPPANHLAFFSIPCYWWQAHLRSMKNRIRLPLTLSLQPGTHFLWFLPHWDKVHHPSIKASFSVSHFESEFREEQTFLFWEDSSKHIAYGRQ